MDQDNVDEDTTSIAPAVKKNTYTTVRIKPDPLMPLWIFLGFLGVGFVCAVLGMKSGQDGFYICAVVSVPIGAFSAIYWWAASRDRYG